MYSLALAGLIVLCVGCSCRHDSAPAPKADEAPKYQAVGPGKSNKPAGPADASPAASSVPYNERGSAYDLPLVIRLDVPEVPEEIRDPSPPISK